MFDARTVLAALLGILALSAVDRLAEADADVDRSDVAAPVVAPEVAAPMQGDSCGDGRCAPPEDCRSCEADCGDCCGDGRCMPPEDSRSCPRDC